MRGSISTRRGSFLSIAALAAVVLCGAPAALAQDPPEIVIQPQDAVVCDGGAVTFTVVAIGDPPLHYQWYRDGVLIPLATEAFYTIDPAGFDDAADYTVEVSNDFGSIESDPATLTVVDGVPPSIIEQPQDAEACDGDSVTFTVTAEGYEPLAYQWRRNGVSIFGATEPAYTIDSVGPDAAAEFSVVVSNVCGWVESETVTLTVHEGPSISQQPQSVSPCEGDSATLSVVASGFGALQYQWRKDGVDIPGANNDTFLIDPATVEDAGEYDVAVTDDCGAVTSSAATVNVRTAPVILTHPDDADACETDSVTFEVVVDGSLPLSYQWYHNGAQVSGATLATLTIDDLETADAGTYYVIVSNDCDVGGVQSETATLAVSVGPTITSQPQSQVACDGGEVTFSVTVSGTEPLAYQWRKNGTVIPGAESDSYTISAVTPTDAGAYDVAVANVCGFEMSDVAMLVIVEGPPAIVEQPQDAAACVAELITFSVTATPDDGLTYQWRKDGVDIPAANGSTYTIVAQMENAGDYDVIVSNPCGATPSEVATLLVADAWPNIVEPPAGDTVCEAESVTFTVTAEGPEPLSYQWYFGGQPIVGATEPSYTIDSAVIGDTGSYRVEVANPCGSDMSAPATLTVLDEAPTIAEQPQAVTACEGATVAFTVTPAGDPPFEYQWYKDGAEIDGATGESYTAEDITVDDAGAYSVVVTNACGLAESDAATLTVNTAVVITGQPASQQLCEGSLVIFSVQTTGTGPIGYQWYKDGEEIEGATQAAYTIASITPADAGSYSVEVTNPCASEMSESATLTVDVGPTITEQPVAPELCVGESVTLTVAATGTEPLGYQWYKNGQPIAGATAATFTLSGLTPNDSGQYHAVVSNICDEAASDSASVVVEEPPLITAQPAPAIIARGQTNEFCVGVAGTEPFDYQWRQDGVAIAGATADCYETGEAGVYSCVVTNRCDQAVSASAELTIATRVTVSITASANGIRLGDSVTLTATADRGLGPYTYLWSTGATASTIVLTPTQTTDYTVTATDALGQIATAEVTVVVALPLTVQARASAYILQPGESSTLTASVLTGGLVPFTFEWSTGATTASIVVTPSVDTTYHVTVTDALGQTGSASVTITVNIETGGEQGDGGQSTDGDTGGNEQPGGEGQGGGTDEEPNQPQQEAPTTSGLCPLVSFTMISLLVAGVCWARGAKPRRRR